jgi:hypothetical protein
MLFKPVGCAFMNSIRPLSSTLKNPLSKCIGAFVSKFHVLCLRSAVIT